MKFIFATITVFLLFSFGFGQTTATTADDKINAEIKQLFKDAETDFASFQGEVQNRGGGIITYQPTKNYFQSAGFTSWFRYYETEKTIGLQFSGSGESAKRAFELVRSEFNPFSSNAEIRSSGNSGEVFVNGQKIALLQETNDKYLMWFYSNRSAWSDFNTSSSNFKLAFDNFGKPLPLMDIIKDVNSNYEDFVKKCNEFFEKEEYPKAIEACTEAIKLKGDDPALYQIRGLSYFFTPDKPKTGLDALTSIGSANKYAAIADLTKCTQLEPSKPECFYALGYVQLKTLNKDELEKSAKSFSEAIRLKSTRKTFISSEPKPTVNTTAAMNFSGIKISKSAKEKSWQLPITPKTSNSDQLLLKPGWDADWSI